MKQFEQIIKDVTDETFLRRLTDFRPFESEFVVVGVVLWVFSF